MIRFLDILFSFLGLILLSPVFLVIAIAIVAESRGGAFFVQERVGQFGKPFGLLKFRTMRIGSESKGQLTVGERDPRITKTGFLLRKYKLDELPQLINVLIGDMSLVGPRPEVKKYVDLYTPEQRDVLRVKPGITDNASLKYFEENKLLAESDDPEKTYVEVIMPAKINLNMAYIERPSVGAYLRVIRKTVFRIFG